MADTILVVEHDAGVAGDIETALRALGYETSRASSGVEALASVAASRPRLVLMATELPGGMDGVEAARVLREQHGLLVVYLASHLDEVTLARAKETQPGAYLLKPFDGRALRASVEVALLRSDLEQRLAASERLADVGSMTKSMANALNNPLASVSANVTFAVENLTSLRDSFSSDGPGVVRPSERARAIGVIDELCAVLDEALRGADRLRAVIEELKRVAGAGAAGRPSGARHDDDDSRTVPPPPDGTVRRGRVLVVDDEPFVARSVERVLRGQHDVTVETDSRAALARLRAGETFDVILCDLMMPELTGMDLFETVAAERPEVARRMVFITGGATTERAEAFVSASAREVMTKPFNVGELRALIADYVK